jgi:hypothetical protein
MTIDERFHLMLLDAKYEMASNFLTRWYWNLRYQFMKWRYECHDRERNPNHHED